MIASAIVLPLAFSIFAGTALFGRNVMAQEKEERYYAAVYGVENGARSSFYPVSSVTVCSAATTTVRLIRRH